ncbi:hypothetical protein [Aquimarina algicola]|uniref:Lipoprotein n=1 Tax=Aquimarina algicola TaxID=2589995 RepID=A0A504J048_9FLAO|nr:hypothetical protein [Aquimarina algicola]TPN81388.1 hypothetical protein FHK87_25725 [Aquimarina algicola]
MTIRFLFIISIAIFISSCSNNAHKRMEMESDKVTLEHSETEEAFISENDAYELLIQQKLQEYIDKQVLLTSHPNFNLSIKKEDSLSTKETKIEKINLIDSFQTVSDSIKKATVKVTYKNTIDTILVTITSTQIEIEGEQIKNTKVSFEQMDRSN